MLPRVDEKYQMAYLALLDFGGAAARQTYRSAPTPGQVSTTAGTLTAVEWSVVAVARRDGRSSLRRPGRASIALRTLLKQPNPRLANARLEALRRMAVLTWADGHAVAPHEVRTFLAAGFTPEQYETLVAGIAAARADGLRPTPRAAPCPAA